MIDHIKSKLAAHAFEHLFIECLGWDPVGTDVVLEAEGLRVELEAVAQKRGFIVFICETHRTVLANRKALRDLQRQLRRSHREHVLIHYCETPRKQVWQWATRVSGKLRIQHREHPFFSDQPPLRLLERIRGLTVTPDEKAQTTLTDVLARVRHALLPDSELQLFAERPRYATQSDRLAMATKQGDPDALRAFVEFHIPLARKSSRMLVRWFGMDADDAEQTAMIGLLQAARRFDPELGYQFSTYANYWIRQCCQRYGLLWGLPIRMPVHLFWPCYKLVFVETQLIATHGAHAAREWFERELSDAGILPEQWRCFCAARNMECFSDVDAPRSALLGLPDVSASVVQDVTDAELRREVLRSLETLKPRQSRILKLRYGLGRREHTLRQAAKSLRITPERVRQIQVKAEEKLTFVLKHAGYGGDGQTLRKKTDELLKKPEGP